MKTENGTPVMWTTDTITWPHLASKLFGLIHTFFLYVIKIIGFITSLWFHPQIALGYSRRVETIITKITNNKK